MSKKKKAKVEGSDSIDIVVGGAETITLECGEQIHVYPLGLRHLRRFNQKFRELIPLLGSINIRSEASEKDVLRAVVGTVTPKLLDDLFDLIEDCVVFVNKTVKLDHLPHWELAPIAETWINISFGEERKWRPWVRAIDNTVARFMPSRQKFSILEIFSRFSLQQDTAEKTSSSDKTPESPTSDGVTDSSSSGLDEANDSTPEQSPAESTSSPEV